MRLLPIIAESGTLTSYACGFYMWSERKAIRLIVNFFLLAIKKHCKVTYLNWKANRKEQLEEALHNLSSDNVYLLFVSFRRFHENFGLN